MVAYCLKALRADRDSGAKAILSFAVRIDDGSGAEDKLGQVQPGYFSDPATFISFLSTNERYASLVSQEWEWKRLGPPDFKDMSRKAEHKVQVRRDGHEWEDLFVNLQLADVGPEAAAPRRWLITSIYKQGVCK